MNSTRASSSLLRSISIGSKQIASSSSSRITCSSISSTCTSTSNTQLRTFHLSSIQNKKKSNKSSKQVAEELDVSEDEGILEDDDLFGPTSSVEDSASSNGTTSSTLGQTTNSSGKGQPPLPFSKRAELLSNILSWEALDTGSTPSTRHLRYVQQAARERDQFEQVLQLYQIFKSRKGNVDHATCETLVRRLISANLPELAQNSILNRNVSGLEYNLQTLRALQVAFSDKLSSSEESVLLSSSVMPGGVKEKASEAEVKEEDQESTSILPSPEILNAKYSILNRMLLLISLSRTYISSSSRFTLSKGKDDPILIVTALSGFINSFNLSSNGLTNSDDGKVKDLYRRADQLLEALVESLKGQSDLISGDKKSKGDGKKSIRSSSLIPKSKNGLDRLKKDLESCERFARERVNGEGEKEVGRLREFLERN